MIGSLGAGIYDTVVGASQKRKARKELEGLERPEMKRMKASLEREGMARNLANQGLPGEQAIRSQIGAGTSRAAKRISGVGGSASDVIAGLTASTTSERQQLQNLGIQSAQARRQNLQNLQGVLGDVAQEQADIDAFNRLDPAMERIRETKQRIAEGKKQQAAGISGIASAANQAVDLAAMAKFGENPDTASKTNTYGGPQAAATGVAGQMGAVTNTRRRTDYNPLYMDETFNNTQRYM